MKVEKRVGVTMLITGHRLDGTNGPKLTDLIKELERESSLSIILGIIRFEADFIGVFCVITRCILLIKTSRDDYDTENA